MSETQSSLTFTPLSHAPWISNATIPVNDNFQLSVSYNNADGEWYAGSIGSYEVAVQVGKPDGEHWSLVQLEGYKDNIHSECDDAKIEVLKALAEKQVFAGTIEVYCLAGDPKKRTWNHRFYCAKGRDLTEKLAYVKSVFHGEDKWRFIPPLLDEPEPKAEPVAPPEENKPTV